MLKILSMAAVLVTMVSGLACAEDKIIKLSCEINHGAYIPSAYEQKYNVPYIPARTESSIIEVNLSRHTVTVDRKIIKAEISDNKISYDDITIDRNTGLYENISGTQAGRCVAAQKLF